MSLKKNNKWLAGSGGFKPSLLDCVPEIVLTMSLYVTVCYTISQRAYQCPNSPYIDTSNLHDGIEPSTLKLAV